MTVEAHAPGTPPRPRRALAYAATIAAAAVAVALICRWGEARFAGAVGTTAGLPPASTPSPADALFHILLVMAAVMLLGHGLARLLARCHQPPVIGEILAGILLGPSVLGLLAPDAANWILPAHVVPPLSAISQLGVVLYMYAVGLELNAGMLGSRGRAALFISHASIAVPFVLGTALAAWMYPGFAPAGVGFTVFALFLGISMSVTAFPVLARILSDSGLTHTPLGTMSLSCAAVGDLTAWCVLALVVGLAKSDPSAAMWTILLSLVYVAVMCLIVRPWLARTLVGWGPQAGRVLLVWGLAAMLVSSLATELIGIHALFGAFLLGAIIPHDSPLAHDLRSKFEELVSVLFLPAFFALTGMRTQIALVSGASEWAWVLVIIAVATAGKFGGTYAAGRLCGLPARDSAPLGLLMNTRGLMELIVLSIGLELGVISPELFSMLVLMALVTTMITGPALAWLGISRELLASAVVDEARVTKAIEHIR